MIDKAVVWMNKKRMVWGLLVCLAWAASETECPAQDDRLNRIEKELAEIKEDVTVIRQMLTEAVRGQAPGEREVSIGDGAMRGDPKAKVTIIEFADFQCPFCARFVSETLPLIDKEYIQTGKVRFVMREYPLTNIHPYAHKAAEAARCAGDQGKYWQMHDKLFQNQKSLEVTNLKEYAKTIGLDAQAFNDCLDGGKQVEKIQRDVLEAQNLRVNGTPGFFLGLTTSGDTIKGTYIEGAQPIELYRQIINSLLKQTDQPQKLP
jgi:protein-disulfide isomerase